MDIVLDEFNIFYILSYVGKDDEIFEMNTND